MAVFEWDGWEFDPAEWRLTSAAKGAVSLPNKSLQVLALLLERAPRLVSKDEILATVWPGTVVEEGNIAYHVAALRKVVDGPGGTSCLETVRGRGYRFNCPVRRRERPAAPAAPVPRPVAPPPSKEAPAAATDAVRLAPAPPVAEGRPRHALRPAPLPPRPRLAHLLPILLLVSCTAVIGWVAVATPPATIRDVAVLPVLVEGESQPIDGAADAVAIRLARLTTLRARPVAAGDPSESPADAGRRLGSETVLRTTVDRSLAPWRVTAELTRVVDGQRIWSGTFDVPADSTDATGHIAAHVTAALGGHLGSRVMPRGTAIAEARRLSVQARESWRLRTPPAVQQAIALYEQAIATDPSYAPAYAGLADCYNLTMSGLPVAVRAVNAKANAERALALDPNLAEAHTSLAFYLYKFEWKWAEAEAEFRRAIAADPSYVLAHHWYGEMMGYLGRYDEAIAELRRAHALEPTSLPIIVDLVGPLLRSGRLAEARALVEAGAALNPMFHGVPAKMAEVLAAEGRERESLEEEWRSMVLRGATMESIEELREAYRIGGRPAALRVEIARLEAQGTDRFEVPAHATFLASRYARLGERDKTLHWIAMAIDRREDIALTLPTYPEFDWLRDDPAFKRQLARLGLPPTVRLP